MPRSFFAARDRGLTLVVGTILLQRLNATNAFGFGFAGRFAQRAERQTVDRFEEYRHLMTASLELAATTDGVAQKLAFLEIARLWGRLAEREARRDVPAHSGEP